MIKVEHLYKKYHGAQNYSIMDISFVIPDGKIVGLLGKNGVGKSTTIKSLCGIFPFDKGTITIDGIDIKKNPKGAKAKIGYAPDDHATYESLGGRECLNYIASLYGLKKAERETRIPYLAKTFDIEYALDKSISSYSHGMKQKICLCSSLLHKPKFWVLDEPMLGLDPQTREKLINYIKSYAQMGNCVLFSSHDIYTAMKLCDYIVIINKGRVVDKIDVKHTKYNTIEKLEQHFLSLTSK